MRTAGGSADAVRASAAPSARRIAHARGRSIEDIDGSWEAAVRFGVDLGPEAVDEEAERDQEETEKGEDCDGLIVRHKGQRKDASRERKRECPDEKSDVCTKARKSRAKEDIPKSIDLR